MNDPRRRYACLASDLLWHQILCVGPLFVVPEHYCWTCARLSLLLDAASLACDLEVAEESIERTREAIPW